MAVVQNTATEVGDVIEIIVSNPVVGLLALTSFVDTIEDETVNRYFQKLFRYSIDGINFSSWIELTNPNLLAIIVEPSDTFYVQYRYIRAGTDISGTITWDNVTLNGTIAAGSTPSIYAQSVFNDYFSHLSIDVLNWAINVLEKLYRPGILAAYIDRFDDTTKDADFIKFWKSITIFFSYLVQYARVFETFTTNRDLCLKFLSNSGTYVSGDETLDELLYIINNRLRDRAKRGTLGMITPGSLVAGNSILLTADSTGYTVDSTTIVTEDSIETSTTATLTFTILFTADSTSYTVDTTTLLTEDSTETSISSSTSSVSVSPVDGELLRLIGWNENDFFKLSVPASKFNSWCVSNSSPSYRSNTRRIDTNLGYENTTDILNLSVYPLLQPSLCSTTTNDSKSVMQINAVPAAQVAGIGDSSDVDKSIVVDHQLNYEITFYVKQSVLGTYLTFGCFGMDEDGAIISLQSVVSGASTQNFFNNQSLAKNDRYYMVRGIIYNSSQALLSATDAKLNLGIGANLRMPSTIKKIMPYIVLDNNTGSPSPAMYVWNVKVNQTGFSYSRSFSNNKNFIDIVMKNNNGRYANAEVDSILRRYMIPYNTSFKSTYL